MIKQLRNYFLLGSLFLTSLSIAKADDIFKGVRGPTKFQLDGRLTYSKNERNIESLTNNLILKYWDGDKLGLWGFLNLPYKNINSSNKSSEGFGDISLGIGPRGRINNFYWCSYAGFTFPTGDEKSNPVLGNGRLDTKIGLLETYITSDKKYEIDGMVEHNVTGKNGSGVNPSDETYIGILGGGKITKKLRLATGFTDLIKSNSDYIANWRIVLRYTASPKLHFELVGDKGIDGHNVQKSTGIGVYMRNNF